MTIKDIGHEMAKQDNRATQYPMFVVYHMVERAVPDGCGESRRKEELEEEWLCEDCLKLYHKDKELPDFCYNCDSECFWNCETELEPDLQAGVFFTAKACQEHIDANHYHYNEPVVYGIGSWRNPEMQAVQKHLLEQAEETIPNHYK